MKVTIVVTAEDIAQGLPKSLAGCPVALAARRVLRSRFDMVHRYGIRLADGTIVAIPGEGVQFVADFDAENPVRPFQFTLNIPDPEQPEDRP